MFLHRRLAVRSRLIAAVLAALVTTTLMSSSARAADPAKYGNSLDWVPADAAFYSSMLRNREQIEIIAKSKAWAKLTNLPTVRQAWQQMQLILSLPGGPLSQLQQIMQQPENQQLVALAGDLVSNEIAFYGDAHSIEFLQLGSQAMNTARFNSMFEQIANGPGGTEPNQQQLNMFRDMLRAVAAKADKLETPTLVVALKHTDADRATAQMSRLEKLLHDDLESVPKLKDRFERRKISSGDYLVLKLDGEMVPWDEIPLRQLEKKPGEFDKLVEKLKGMTLVVSLGVRGDYVLLSIGPSTDHLANLGTGKLLASRPEFEPLAKAVGERLTSIHFATKESRLAEQASAGNLAGLLDAVREVLPTSPLPKDTQQRIENDLQRLARSAETAIGRLGPQLSFSYLTPRGSENYSYDWSAIDGSIGSKPLDLVEHVGGTPLLAVVGRGKVSTDDYRQLVEVAKLAHGYFEELALPQMPPDAQAQYHQMMDFAKPLLQRASDATEKMLLPGLADGQCGLVLDAKLSSRQWFKGMPRAANPLPMLEPAIVFGVSDPELVKKAFGEYRSVADAIVDKIKQMNPEALPPDFKLPDPQVRETKNGAVYSYPFAKELGVDGQLAPNAGLSKNVAVLSVAPKHTGELLASTPFEAEGPAGETNRPLLAISYFDWASVVEAATPWIDYAVEQNYSAKNGGDNGTAQPDGMRNTLGEVHGVLEVLQALRTVSSATYLEGKATVTHTETHFRDVQ
jgi:hypothetical protein